MIAILTDLGKVLGAAGLIVGIVWMTMFVRSKFKVF
jgi:hypothetical protein